jgi:UDP-N-acetylmuramyl pentapeptide phosphotransferase/UDP-N-acetylglucosamine-1-phosphate transferase
MIGHAVRPDFSSIGILSRYSFLNPVKTTAMDHHHEEINEKKILTIGGIVIFIVVAVISYLEWRGKTGR